MKEPKFPRNKYLDEGSKRILNETLLINQLEDIFHKFAKEGSEISDKKFKSLFNEIHGWALESVFNLIGVDTFFEEGEIKGLRDNIKKFIGKNPSLEKALKDSGIEFEEDIPFSKIKEFLASEEFRRITSNDESKVFITNFLTTVRKETYTRLAGKNKAIKEKVDTIYNILKKAFTSDNVEKVNSVLGSELYTRTISLVQNYSSLVKSFRTLSRNTGDKGRAHLNDLQDRYVTLYGHSEILIKLLYAMKQISVGKEVNAQSILSENVGNLINSLNKTFPGLINFDARIRNAHHSGGVRYRKNDSEIVFSTKNNPDLVLSREGFIRECKRAADTAFALIGIQQILFVFMFDTILNKIKQENKTNSQNIGKVP
jgi:hypothetical protein